MAAFSLYENRSRQKSSLVDNHSKQKGYRMSTTVNSKPSPKSITEKAVNENRRKYGDLHRYADGEYLRAATADEYAESRATGFEGVIMVGGVACYVE